MNENWQRDDENFVADETSELQVRGNNRVVPDKAVEFIPVYLNQLPAG